jgi:nitrogenase subunit NifH
MSGSTAILGKGGVGKTFVTAHLAMALGSMGIRTLVVGCDQKRDSVRALSRAERPTLMDALEGKGFAYDELPMAEVTVPVGDFVDALELGASPLLVGHYAAVLEEAFHTFDRHELWSRYDHLIFDVTDERFDAAYLPLFRRVNGAVAVTTESAAALFVVNRLMRAALIGANEFDTRLKLVGVINNRSVAPLPYTRFVERTRLFPLLTIPDLAELARLRPFHRTLFGLEPLPPALKPVHDGFVTLADLVRGDPFTLYPLNPLLDDEIWKLEPPVSLEN